MAGDVRANRAAKHGRRYAAFISYSNADEEIGDWLHRRLENYRVPSPLRGRAGPAGPISARLGPVFRDRVELSAAPDLGAEIRRALQDSDALIVLCSPRSRGSRYVGEEIRTFKLLGRGNRIFAAIIDGEPHAAGKPGYSAADECFPGVLIYQLDATGGLTSAPEPVEPLAADFRDGKDGRENGSLKLIAGMLGVGLDELVQREKQAERRRRFRANVIAAGMSVLALAAVLAGSVAFWQRGVAVDNEQRALRGETAARENLARAEQNAREREQQRQLANYNAEQAGIQALAARRGEANARLALARIFAERSWQAKDRGAHGLAARYALAGWRLSPQSVEEYRAALGSALNDAGFSIAVDPASGVVRHAQVSPDNRTLALAAGQMLELWQATDFQRTAQLAGHEATLESLVFNGNGSKIVTGDANGIAIIWNTAAPYRRVVLHGHTRAIESALFSPDDRRVITASTDGTVRVWDTETGAQLLLLRGEDDWAHRAIFSPDGARISAVFDNGGLGVWDAGDGRRLLWLAAHDEPAHILEYSPDGTRLLTGSYDGFVKVWDTTAWTQLAGLGPHGQLVLDAHFDRSGERVATSGRGENYARIWNAATGAEIARLGGHGGYIRSVRFDPAGTGYMTASWDGTLRLWAVGGEQMAVLRGHEGPVGNASYSPDGSALISVGDGGARVWPIVTIAGVESILRHEAGVTRASFSPDGRSVLTSAHDNAARTWDFTRRRTLVTFTGHTGSVHSAVYNRDGSRVLTASNDRTARIWDAESGRPLLTLEGHRHSLRSAAFSRNGARIASSAWQPLGGADDPIRIWDAQTGAEVAQLPAGRAAFGSRAFSTDGRRIALAADNAFSIWDIEERRAVRTLTTERTATINALAWSDDGGLVVTASNDQTARVWDVTTGRLVSTLSGHGNYVNSAAFSADGTRVVTAGNDGAARIWDVSTGREIAALRGHNDIVLWAEFSPNSQRVVTASRDQTAMVWVVANATRSMAELADTACRHFLRRQGRAFSDVEIAADPLIRDVWVPSTASRDGLCLQSAN
jgi:WD40 repeat protein